MLAVVCAVLLFDKIDLTLVDLGRHIKNGEFIIHGTAEQRHAVLHTNFYSCATPDFPFINHHWLTGVLFYLLWTKISFDGLTIFYAAMIATAVVLFYLAAAQATNPILAAPLAALALPVLTQRTEIRPEGITYLFMAVFYLLLSGKLPQRYLYALPVLMALWLNFHIGFVFGFLLLGAFFLKAVLAGDRQKSVLLAGVTAASAVAACINPAGLAGLLYPLNIFRNYGYEIGENRPLIFFLRMGDANPEWQLKLFAYVLGMAAAIVILWWAIMKDIRPRLPELLLLGSTAVLALTGIRNIPVFSMLMIPLLAVLLDDILKKKAFPWTRLVAAVIFIASLGFCWVRHQDRDRAGFFGIGLKEGSMASAEFLKTNGVIGPVFNDFNNGSYLIFNLPQPGGQFLDNRPEAYPPDIFQLHRAMEADDNVWRLQNAKYHFNAIVYSLQFNNAPETERFLLARVKDPEWAPVFSDDYNLIYLRRNDRNAAAIKAHELPRSMFK